MVLYGNSGLGKTEYACALMHAVAPAHVYHFINKVDRVRDVVFSPGDGLVIDETCFVEREIDDVKGLLDVEKGRDVVCRNRDGFIPRGTPRIFSTNWPWELFWPREALCSAHSTAIVRRVLWIHVTADLRLGATTHDDVADALDDAAAGCYGEEDVFGLGPGLD